MVVFAFFIAGKDPCLQEPSPCNTANSDCEATEEDFVCSCKEGFEPVPSSENKLCKGQLSTLSKIFTRNVTESDQLYRFIRVVLLA